MRPSSHLTRLWSCRTCCGRMSAHSSPNSLAKDVILSDMRQIKTTQMRSTHCNLSFQEQTVDAQTTKAKSHLRTTASTTPGCQSMQSLVAHAPKALLSMLRQPCLLSIPAKLACVKPVTHQTSLNLSNEQCKLSLSCSHLLVDRVNFSWVDKQGATMMIFPRK